jgi:hypothetical protein
MDDPAAYLLVTAYACLREACEAMPDPELEHVARDLAAHALGGLSRVLDA